MPVENIPQEGKWMDSLGFLKGIMLTTVVTVVMLSGYSIFFLSPSFTELIAENTENEAIRIGRHISNSIFENGKTINKDSITENFPEYLDDLTHNFEMTRVKVFAPDGEIIFSTHSSDIGKINRKKYFHTVVAKGGPYTKIVQADTKSLEGQTLKSDVVETYVPIMKDGKFLGAFEIYFDITASKTKLDRLVNYSNIMLLVIAFGLLSAVVFISIKARRNIIDRQHAEEKIIRQSADLTEINSELSVLNEISSAISRSIDMDHLLPRILKTITTRLHTYIEDGKASIFLVTGDQLDLAAMVGFGNEFIPLHEGLTTKDCHCGKAARKGEMLFIPNSVGEGRTVCCGTDAAHGHIIIPLMASNTVEGVLNLFTPVDIDVQHKRRLFESIGNQIGVALENAKLFEETKRLSLHDPLTGLANRRYMEKSLERSIAQARRYGSNLAIGMIDIDYFKKFNDTYGHAAGDKLLADLATIISAQLRKADLAARYGGEEFIVILPEAGQEDAMNVMERICNEVERQTAITISIGVCVYVTGMSRDSMLEKVDNALYRAKEQGRNRVVMAQNAEAQESTVT